VNQYPELELVELGDIEFSFLAFDCVRSHSGLDFSNSVCCTLD